MSPERGGFRRRPDSDRFGSVTNEQFAGHSRVRTGRNNEIGRETAFEQMYRKHEPKVLAYALRRASPELAKDAVAETFLAAWRRFDQLSVDPLPWLIAVARKALANQRRASGRQLRLASRLAEVPPENSTTGDQLDDAAVTRRALARLRHDEREALLLIGWDGLTPAQAADSLGCAAATFRVRLHRARRRFARFLAEEQDEASEWHQPEVAEELSRP
jgi:RNA polymerase sigma factor (sigma-70 family)